MVIICTDSCSDLSQELIKDRSIEVIPLQVFIEGKSIKDGTITLQDLFNSVKRTGQLPKTSAPAIADFVNVLSKADDVIYIGISEKLSTTIHVAQLAAQQIGNKSIYIVDSKNLSTGIGLLVLKAADFRDQGMDAEAIYEQVKALPEKIRTAFVIDTMEYLHKGGRCTGIQALAGSILQIRPIISVLPDGSLGVKHKIRGTRQKALDTLINDFRSDLPEIDLQRVFVTHSDCELDANYLVDKIKEAAPFAKVLVTMAGSTIGSHCGPNTIGILYLKNR